MLTCRFHTSSLTILNTCRLNRNAFKITKYLVFSEWNFAFLGKSSVVNVLTRCQKLLGKSFNTFNDLINVFRDHFRQNKVLKKLLRGQVITFAANYEYTSSKLWNSPYILNIQFQCIFWRYQRLQDWAFNSTLSVRSNASSLTFLKTSPLNF